MKSIQNPQKRNLFKTSLALAAAIGTAGATTAALSGCESKSNNQNTKIENNNEHSDEKYNLYGAHQQGITTPHQPFSITAAFDVLAKSKSQLEILFRAITARSEFLTQGGELIETDPKLPPAGSGILGKIIKPDGLTITLSLGASLFDDRFGLKNQKPKHLIEMERFPNDKLAKQWCDGDISLQICALSPETCQNALRDIIKNTSQLAVIRWSIEGFLPKAPAGQAARNLFGFRDGSANPDVSNTNIANQVLWTGIADNSLDEPAWTKNGSYQAIRLIRHFVEFWDRTPLQEQETIFGREKYSGAPLGGEKMGWKKEMDNPDYSKDPKGEIIPKDSHIRLANSRNPDFMKKHLLFRRPYDYSRGLSKAGQLDVGLVFICYQANLNDGFIFVQNLLNNEPLEEYISPFGGGYFFTVPGIEKGQFLAQQLMQAA